MTLNENAVSSQVQQKREFDPVKGCQIQSTGILGGFFIITLAAAYAFYKTTALAGGGPAVLTCIPPLPKGMRFAFINREYIDVMTILLLGFAFMATWEFCRTKAERLINLAIAVAGISLAWAAALSSPLFFNSDTAWFLGWEWTRFETAYAAILLSLIPLWLIHIIRRKQHMAGNSKASLSWAVKTGFFRWLSGLIVFTIVLVIFLSHPFYRNMYYENWRITVSYLYMTYLLLGFPYAVITNFLRKNKGEDRKDPGFMALLVMRAAFCRLRGRWKGRLKTAVKNRATLVVLRDLGVKFFFVPLMTTFLFMEFGSFSHGFTKFLNQAGFMWADLPQYIENYFRHGNYGPWPVLFNHFYNSAFHGIFVMDVSLSLVGYACTSRWLNNKSKSVDPYLSGWLIALICYPPFNSLASEYMPYNRSFGDVPYLALTQYAMLDPSTAASMMGALDTALKTVTLLVFCIYLWATMSFGLRFSNLTNRGIITQGPYKWIRHPAYASKNIAWWAENVRNFSNPWQLLFLAAWNYIYFLRARTEERHLKKDPDYLAYCKQVKYKFIPGLW